MFLLKVIPLFILFLLHCEQTNSEHFEVTHQVYFNVKSGNKDLGKITIGLFGNLAPKAVKNFYEISTNGINGKTFKNTKFHRVIKRFMIQGGDVVHNNGSGTISIYGPTFKDENLKTKHSASGFVSMANNGKNTNGCQFFITTIPTPWLDGMHTVIGKVVDGQNVVHLIEHISTDVDDRPLEHVRIVKCGSIETTTSFQISDNPYDIWGWLRASAVPLTMSFSILGFFHWMIRKMDIQ